MFTVERYTRPGPHGGKPRGYCLEWQGRGEAPGGRAKRSGWYLHRRDAESAARVANDAAAALAARPSRPPRVTGDGAWFVRFTDPSGAVYWSSYGPETPDGEQATRYTGTSAAARALSAAMGHGPAFWNSERAARENQRRRMRGWAGEVVSEHDLPEMIEGNGEFRAGRGSIVSAWHPTPAAALAEFATLQRESANV